METGAGVWMRAAAAAPPPGAAPRRSRCSDRRFFSQFPSVVWRDNPKLRFAGLSTSTSQSQSQSQSLPLKPQPLRVKSHDTEENPNPNLETPIQDEQSLQEALQAAIKQEDYSRAANLRDQIRLLQEDNKSSVLSANSRFYTAFKTGDLTAMHNIWSKGDHVYVIHPSAGRIEGYEMVMGSWEIVLGADYEFPIMIDLKNVEVFVKGGFGYVSCLEVVKTKGSSWGRQVATNVFEKVDGKWFICVHHASHMDE
ncbi:hypothetical protein LUZ60_000776 [Juncus effusus]|nr:hypothetical protein LUZ60_000776 [Juncus effusus]